jgi:hypothetical protein
MAGRNTASASTSNSRSPTMAKPADSPDWAGMTARPKPSPLPKWIVPSPSARKWRVTIGGVSKIDWASRS